MTSPKPLPHPTHTPVTVLQPFEPSSALCVHQGASSLAAPARSDPQTATLASSPLEPEQRRPLLPPQTPPLPRRRLSPGPGSTLLSPLHSTWGELHCKISRRARFSLSSLQFNLGNSSKAAGEFEALIDRKRYLPLQVIADVRRRHRRPAGDRRAQDQGSRATPQVKRLSE